MIGAHLVKRKGGSLFVSYFSRRKKCVSRHLIPISNVTQKWKTEGIHVVNRKPRRYKGGWSVPPRSIRIPHNLPFEELVFTVKQKCFGNNLTLGMMLDLNGKKEMWVNVELQQALEKLQKTKRKAEHSTAWQKFAKLQEIDLFFRFGVRKELNGQLSEELLNFSEGFNIRF